MNGQSPAGWPAGKTLALMVNAMLEAWSDDSAPHNVSSSAAKPRVIDTRGQSWGALRAAMRGATTAGSLLFPM